MTKVNSSLQSPSSSSTRTPADVVVLQWLGILLVATVWVSAGLFGLYILAFYAASLFGGDMEKWNSILPGLYHRDAAAATTGIGLHFAAGGIILVLGSLQLIDAVRIKMPAFHRWTGRLYVMASALAAIGGLIFIVLRGTIGGTVMNTGFGLYGTLMLLASIQTYRYAVRRNTVLHRAWALRLYALAIGSWLYRMDYGFWAMLHRGGHEDNFRGPFDQVMAFFFYIPNLVIAEIFIRERKVRAHPLFNILAIVILLFVIAFLLTGTYYFTKIYWGPAIAGLFI